MDEALHLVDAEPPAAKSLRHFRPARFERRQKPRRGLFAILGRDRTRRADQRLLQVAENLVRVLDQPCAFLEPAFRPVEHGFHLYEARG